MSRIETRNTIEKKFASSMESKWDSMPNEERKTLVDDFLYDFDKEINKAESLFKEVQAKRESYLLVFVGIFFGLFGGLATNTIGERYSTSPWYGLIILVVFILSILIMFKSLNYSISKKFKNNKLLSEIIEDVYSKKTDTK